eukprot:11213643-Lingulodinium_polyedra.AAC.1
MEVCNLKRTAAFSMVWATFARGPETPRTLTKARGQTSPNLRPVLCQATVEDGQFVDQDRDRGKRGDPGHVTRVGDAA